MTDEEIAKRTARLPKGSTKGRKVVRIGALTNAALMAMLIRESETGVTYAEMITETGLCVAAVREYMLALHRAGVVYIHHYEHDTKGRQQIKAYAFGQKKDAPRPGPRNPNLRATEYRDRKRQARMLGLTSVRELPRATA